MYHHYFGLSESAFSIAVNPRYLYMSAQHKEALAHLLYGVQGGGFVLLTGEVGTGKTTIIRSLLEQLPEQTDIAMVFNPMANVPEMLGMILDELRVDYDKSQTSVKCLTDVLHHFLLDNHAHGRNTVLLIDEAQLLSADVLEQIRLLTNLETNTQKLLQIILVGQPELNSLLSQPRLRQLTQRITARFHLSPLGLAETRAYIAHRLQVAGLDEDKNPFTPGIVKKIHQFSGGIPRRINILCERILIGLYGHNQHQVDNKIFQLAKKEVVGHLDDPSRNQRAWSPWLTLLPLLLLTVLLALWLVVFNTHSPAPIITPDLEPETVAEKTAVDNVAAFEVEPVAGYILRGLQQGQNHLFEYLGVNLEDTLHPCLGDQPLLRCENIELTHWEQVVALNRPLLLTVITEERFTAYVVLTGVHDEFAQVLNEDGLPMRITLAEIGPLWTGRAFYAWRSPPGFRGAVTQGDRGRIVTWLAEQFALMDGQEKPLTQDVYNRALAERVKIFQQGAGLDADGIAGPQTFMKINEVMGFDITLKRQGILSNRPLDDWPVTGQAPL